MRNLRRLALLAVTTLALAGMAATVAAVPAQAAPCRDSCGDPSDPGTTPSGPTVTTLGTLSPDHGWSGDTVQVSGWHLAQATVKVNGTTARITADTDILITFTVPAIPSGIPFGTALPVVVSTSYGTATASFRLSPELTGSGRTEFNSRKDGWAYADYTLNRSTGAVHSDLEIDNVQPFVDLSVDIAVAWLGVGGVVIGFTSPTNLIADGTFYNMSDTVSRKVSQNTVLGPSPSIGGQVLSAQVVFKRNAGNEFLATLLNAVGSAMTIAVLIAILA